MSKTDSLHYRLCLKGAEWLRRQEFGSYKIVAVELVCYNVENPDVWGTTGFKTAVIEVKTSRADFLRDKNKRCRKDKTYSCGNKRFYLTPKGLLKPSEILEHWGLLEYDGEDIQVIRDADDIPCQNHGDIAMLCSIMRREGVKSKIYNYRQ